MAPRTRSNRAEKLAVQKLLSSGVGVNTRGLPALPIELYLEILSHLPAFSIPQDVWVDNKPDPYRQLTLYYLSQTCRSLRAFFLRYAWERIEVFGGMWTPTGRLATKAERRRRGVDMKELCDKKLVEETLRQLETVVVRNPDLRQYVSGVNMTIVRHSYDLLLPEIAQGLSVLPNLHTLQLNFRHHDPYRRSQQFFSAFRYPNVRTLNVACTILLEDLLVACPNIKNYSLYKDLDVLYYSDIKYLLSSGCTGIEKLGVQIRLQDRDIAALVDRLPRLRDLSLECESLRSHTNFNPLSKLPLHTIRLRLDNWNQNRYFVISPATQHECRSWIELAKGILAKCPQGEVAKKVMVVNYDKTVDIYDV